MDNRIEDEINILNDVVPLSKNEQSVLKDRVSAYIGSSLLKDFGVAALTFLACLLISIPLFHYSRNLLGIDSAEKFFALFLFSFAALSYGASRRNWTRISEALLIFAFFSSSLTAPFGAYNYLSSLLWFIAAIWALNSQKPLLHGALLALWAWVFVAAAARVLAEHGNLPIAWTVRTAFAAVVMVAGSVFKASRVESGTVLYEYLLRPVHKNVTCFVMLASLLGLTIRLNATEPWYLSAGLAVPLIVAIVLCFIDGRKRRDPIVASLSIAFIPALMIFEMDQHGYHTSSAILGICVGLGFVAFAALKSAPTAEKQT
jgi:hypothetical protein